MKNIWLCDHRGFVREIFSIHKMIIPVEVNHLKKLKTFAPIVSLCWKKVLIAKFANWRNSHLKPIVLNYLSILYFFMVKLTINHKVSRTQRNLILLISIR